MVVRPSEKRKKVVLLSSSSCLFLAHHLLSLCFFFSSPCPPSLPRTSCSTTRPSSSEGQSAILFDSLLRARLPLRDHSGAGPPARWKTSDRTMERQREGGEQEGNESVWLIRLPSVHLDVRALLWQPSSPNPADAPCVPLRPNAGSTTPFTPTLPSSQWGRTTSSSRSP